jgi:hypothetical protein
MPTIGELINNLAVKAGIDPADNDLKSLLASPELATVKVPDTIVTAIDNGLLSIEAAKNNHPEVKKKYFADAYDGIDKQLMKLVESETFDQADLDEINAERSTSKKQELIITKLKAAKAQAKGADKEEINRQIAAAHESARLAKAEVDSVKNDYEGRIANIQKTAALKAVFSNYKTIYDDLPIAARNAAFEALVSTALQDKNAELKTDEHGNLIIISKDGSNVFGANHVQLTPSSFLDQTFAPILKVSGHQKPAAHRPTHQQAPVKTSQPDGSEVIVSQIESHNAKVLADMAVPKSVMI